MSIDPDTKPTVDDLRKRLKASESDAGFVSECREAAFTLVDKATAGAELPDSIRQLAVSEVAADLFHRRRVRHGVANFDGPDFSPVRITRDPMKAAEDILRPFIRPGMA